MKRVITIFTIITSFLSYKIALARDGDLPTPPASRNLMNNYAFGNLGSFGELISNLLPVVFIIATTVVTLYFIYGVFKLIISGGDKNQVEGARNTITHAVIGFILLILVFVVVKLIPEVLGLTNYSIIQ